MYPHCLSFFAILNQFVNHSPAANISASLHLARHQLKLKNKMQTVKRPVAQKARSPASNQPRKQCLVVVDTDTVQSLVSICFNDK